MAPRFTGELAPPPPVKRLKAQTSDKFPDIKLQYRCKKSRIDGKEAELNRWVVEAG